MNIGVIGVGVVGGAVLKAFQSVTNTVGYDIQGPLAENWGSVTQTDMVFICVPSPTINGEQDLSALQSVIKRLQDADYRGVVCIKCTVLPGTCDYLRAETGLRICHNPEFLTAAKPFEDFMNQQAVIVGGFMGDTSVVKAAYTLLMPQVPCLLCSSAVITEVAKYMRNNYLAMKVSFANEYYNLCQYLGADFNEVKWAMFSQGGIEQGHWAVPGPDGKCGYSGMCFPKDVRAMSSFLKKNGLTSNVITATEETNQVVRPHDNYCKEI